MDWLLLILAIALILVGILGCVLPVIPGPPISFIALLVLQPTRFADFSTKFLLIAAVAAIIVTILDYIVPVWGTKKFGGSKAGVWGATIGLIIGMFFSPFSAFLSILLGPFIGAIVGEMIAGKDSAQAFKAGMGSFLGFLLGIGLKLMVSFGITFFFVKEIIYHIRG